MLCPLSHLSRVIPVQLGDISSTLALPSDCCIHFSLSLSLLHFIFSLNTHTQHTHTPLTGSVTSPPAVLASESPNLSMNQRPKMSRCNHGDRAPHPVMSRPGASELLAVEPEAAELPAAAMKRHSFLILHPNGRGERDFRTEIFRFENVLHSGQTRASRAETDSLIVAKDSRGQTGRTFFTALSCLFLFYYPNWATWLRFQANWPKIGKTL